MKLRIKLVISFSSVVIGMLIAISLITYLTLSEVILKNRLEYYTAKSQNEVAELSRGLRNELDIIQRIFQPTVSELEAGRQPKTAEKRVVCDQIKAHPLVTDFVVTDEKSNSTEIGCGTFQMSLLHAINRSGKCNKPSIFVSGSDLVVRMPLRSTGEKPGTFCAIIRLNRTYLESIFSSRAIDDALLIVSSNGHQVYTHYPRHRELFQNVTTDNVLGANGSRLAFGKKNYYVYSHQTTPLALNCTYIIPERAILNDIFALKDRLITALILLGWVSIWLVLLIAHRLTRPIVKLSEAIKQVGSENYDYAIEITGSDDEVGVLAANFEVARKKIKELTSVDALTQAYNRRYLMNMLELAVIKAERNRQELACIMLDVDHFKALNDTHGHLAGDEVLVSLGKLLRGHFRPYDIVARFGGEEFVVILPEVPQTEACEVAERMRQIVMQHVVEYKNLHIQFTISLGVAYLTTLPSKTAEDLLDAADKALYRAKKLGRNRVVVSNQHES